MVTIQSPTGGSQGGVLRQRRGWLASQPESKQRTPGSRMRRRDGRAPNFAHPGADSLPAAFPVVCRQVMPWTKTTWSAALRKTAWPLRLRETRLNEFRALAEAAREVRNHHREALETIRQEREQLRDTAETSRVASEDARRAAETARTAIEEARVATHAAREAVVDAVRAGRRQWFARTNGGRGGNGKELYAR